MGKGLVRVLKTWVANFEILILHPKHYEWGNALLPLPLAFPNLRLPRSLVPQGVGPKITGEVWEQAL
jgi:hypothetical protein